MATSSFRGNNELSKVRQIGEGPAECQLRSQGGGGMGRSAGSGGLGAATELDRRPQAWIQGCVHSLEVRWGPTRRTRDVM